MQVKVALLTDLPSLLKELQKAIPGVYFYEIVDTTDGKLQEAEILIANYALIGPHINKLRKLKWMQGTWAGIETLTPYIDKKLPFLVTRFTGRHFGQLLSEYVIAQIINAERDLYTVYDNQKMCDWNIDGKIYIHRPLTELTIGIMGYGTLGKWIAKKLHMLGANIVAYGRNSTSNGSSEILTKYYSKPTLPEFLAKSDYIVNVLPETEQTTGLLNGNILQHCYGKETVFINIGRGTIINEEDLINALNNDWISIAILDVFTEEPFPTTSPLWHMKKVKITPHIAGVSQAKHVVEQFQENLKLYLENQPIPATVNFSKGY